MKIQYYPMDLAYALGIGEITEMHIEVINDVPVLRIECEKQKAETYETVHVSKKIPKITASKRSTPAKPQRASPQTRDKDLGGKLMDFGKKWMSNKEKPNFMKDAGF